MRSAYPALTRENSRFSAICDELRLAAAAADGFLGFRRAGGGNFGDFCLGRADVEALAELQVYFGEDVAVFLEESAGVFAALTDALAVVAVPGARFLDDIVGNGQVEDVAFAADAFAVENVELGFAEWCGHFVLDDLDFGAGADHLVAFLDGGDAADVDANGGVELEGAAAGGGFGIAEHDTDFFADLVDEDQCGARFGDRAGELA